MARARMVTRAIIGTEVQALVFSAEEKTCVEKTILIAGVYKSVEKLDKKLHSIVDDDKQTFVKVVSAKQKSTLYGMSEDDFIAHSVELDPVSRRAIEADETDEAEA